MTKVFSTNRGIREYYSNFSDKNTLLPKAITISEFESKSVIVKNRTFIDNDNRFLLLREAAKFKEFHILQFNPEFLTFLNHSEYLFKFFEEIAGEGVSIDDLRAYDTYALFDEHLDVLGLLRQRYISLLDKYNFVDKINIAQHYEINEDYLRNLGEVHLSLDGFLNRYEIDLIKKCSEIIPFYVELELNKYNQKTKDIFEYLGFKLEINNRYILDITNQKIITCRAVEQKHIVARVNTFDTRYSQIGFVFSSIEEFVRLGILPQNIVVVLPDENIVPVLDDFDTFNNLNFAMGFSVKNSNLYKRIEAISLYFNTHKDEDRTRVKRLGITDELLHDIQKYWNSKNIITKSIEFIETILKLDEKEGEKSIFKEEIFRFSNFLSNLQYLKLEQVIRLFLDRLKDRSEDDVGGGKITVMGLLETRGSSYEGVIVMDFNDDFVPRRSGKDLFLNTSIRKKVGLPTKKDRENLQKYYYHQLFNNAKKVAISSVENETTMPSRFLDELGLSSITTYKTNVFNNLLFKKAKFPKQKIDSIKDVKYDLKGSPLSATKFATLLTCKRKFYFKYIKKLQEADNILVSSSASTGLKLHIALERIFAKGRAITDENELFLLLKKELLSLNLDEIEEFDINVWLVRLKNFIANELDRYKNGFRIYGNEVSLEGKFRGFDIKGKLDRIDIKDGKLYVIDYKSGDIKGLINQKLEKMTNFQLEFYYLLASDLAEVDGIYYYDLKDGKLIQENNLAQKIDRLKELLDEFKEPIKDFELCENIANCRFCPYKKLCMRDI